MSLLKLQTSPPPSHHNNEAPPPHMVQGTPEYEVDSIINHCYHYGKLQYLVLWKGYSVDESS
ncbi:hypothetical protein DSO57_1027134 [Entomophthora muscae]|uniref:Uncharacterized protein n=1 Tax=Entomophthora muscae TaxID=34485 RepID=A0ACC2RGJ5_9FUNG|nr:hypothetical protein DSO57_1027134 [Entomophthora muscae]